MSATEVHGDQIIVAQEEFYVVLGRVAENKRWGA
jgi:hypothetical protein